MAGYSVDLSVLCAKVLIVKRERNLYSDRGLIVTLLARMLSRIFSCKLVFSSVSCNIVLLYAYFLCYGIFVTFLGH